MKRLFFTLTAIVTLAVCASAQIPGSDAAKNPLNYTSSNWSDSVLSHIRILPNPSSGMIVVMVDDANANVLAPGELVVYSSGGYPVAKKAFTTGANDIYINNFSSGIYFLRLMTKSGAIAVKEFAIAR